jgi:hypothetical protein
MSYRDDVDVPGFLCVNYESLFEMSHEFRYGATDGLGRTSSTAACPRSIAGDSARGADDNLKAVLVAWIIAGHAMLGYAAIGGWPYDG